MKYWIHLLFLLMLLGCSTATNKQLITRVSPEPKDHAWWLRIEFVPVHNEIRGVPLHQIDPSWRLASELREEAIPPELLLERGTDIMQESGLYFSLHGDFNNDGIEDLVLVGVYENKSNERGSFVLILSRDDERKWRKSFLQYLGKPGFTALDNKTGSIRVWFCMECDYGASLVWDKKTKKYLLRPLRFED
jgi:hypothetical protein